MIALRNRKELEIMREAGRISAEALRIGGEAVVPGATTAHICNVITRYIKSQKATPSFLGYGGFPAGACVSVNNEVIHGLPGGRVILEGDIVSIDVGAHFRGYHGDNAATFAAGKISAEARRLLDETRESLYRAIAAAVSGKRIGDVSNAVQTYAESKGLGVVKAYVGHGIGREMHESPEIPNYGKPGHGPRLAPGMVLAIEPMVNAGSGEVYDAEDGWTVLTTDGSLSAHFEHTVAITDNGPVILTLL
jgi:methionyl aminopeptidase